MLSRLEKERYLRHIMLEDVGEEGQLKLLKSSVLVVGAWGSWISGFDVFVRRWDRKNRYCGF
ncbi:thiamin biosynthesis protein [Helicobacter pylori CPY3281]|nr:thiamin biosynthesis protein [Helicobacter pylori CPY3281]BAJ55145.1 thiamin biosynthesis protein [Helicobacter pylori F16]